MDFPLEPSSARHCQLNFEIVSWTKARSRRIGENGVEFQSLALQGVVRHFVPSPKVGAAPWNPAGTLEIAVGLQSWVIWVSTKKG